MLTQYKGMRRFVRWAVAEGDIDVDPMANLEQPRPREHPVPLLSDDEIGRRLSGTDGPDLADRRDHAMKMFFQPAIRREQRQYALMRDLRWPEWASPRRFLTGEGGETPSRRPPDESSSAGSRATTARVASQCTARRDSAHRLAPVSAAEPVTRW